MAHEIRSDKGLPIRKQGNPVLATDTLEVKIAELDEKNKSFVAVASTEHEDRDKDIVRQDGWVLANFKKNPVVPWSHNYYGVPIARSQKTWVDNDKQKGPRLLFMPKFDENDEDSMKVFNKYKNGFLTSFSVGFQGLKYEFRDEEDRWWGGREFTKQELLEISAVAVPANPHANTRLGYAGDNQPDNMIQMGYPEVFAKTASGLFYPVMDIAVFTQPREFEVDKGVIGISATALDDEMKVSDPIAYMFDPEQFDDKSANEWVKANVGEKWKVKYFDLRTDETDNITLECVTAEDNIKHFETSIDLSNLDVSDSGISDKDASEDTNLDDNKANDDTDEKEIQTTEDNKQDTDEDATDDKSSADGDDTDDNKSLDDDDTKSDDGDVTIQVKRIIEITTTIKDHEGNEIDKGAEVIASNKEFKSVHEFIEWRSNEVISFMKGEIDALRKQVAELAKEKTVANTSDLADNKSDSDDDSDTSKQNTSTNDDTIELDDSLIKTPGDDDKTKSDDVIEIDESMLEGDTDIKHAVEDTLVEKLRKSLSEVLQGASGKID